MGVKSKGFVVPSFSDPDADSGKQRIWTDAERKKMRAAIDRAGSLAEIEALEKDLKEGRIPKWVLDGPDPMET
jgi:hypothetical protein